MELTPEQIELEKKRRALERLKDKLADREEEMADLRAELEQAFAAGPEELAVQWRRDHRVLDLAQAAREKRLQKALQTLGMAA